jgi:hypothetical protein
METIRIKWLEIINREMKNTFEFINRLEYLYWINSKTVKKKGTSHQIKNETG